MLLWFLPLFLIIIMIGLPVVFGLLAAPIALIMLEGDGRNVVAGLYRNLYNGMDSFPLMALPFFMLHTSTSCHRSFSLAYQALLLPIHPRLDQP
jgi:hypothetical protein